MAATEIAGAPARGSGSGERLHALDAVRGGMLLLGVFFHATLSFMDPRIWIVGDEGSAALTVTFFVLHIFRMTVFFVIAGFFGRLLYQRLGLRGFAINRAKRIAMPFAIFWMPVLAAIIGVLIWSAIHANGGQPIENPPPPPPMNAQTFPLTHLWFLYTLILFYVAALALRGLVVLIDRSGALRSKLDVVVRVLVKSPLAPFLLGAPLFAVLALKPDWMMWFGIPTPDTGLIPNNAALAAFGVAFGLGWLLHRQIDLMRAWEKTWLLNLGFAVILTCVCLWLGGLKPELVNAEMGWKKFAFAGAYVLAVWAWTFAILGGALRFLSDASPVRRYVADASYWVYIVHLPILLVGQMLVLPLALPALAKYALLTFCTLALCFATYHTLVRYTFVGAILNGRKQRPAKQSKQLAPVAAE